MLFESFRYSSTWVSTLEKLHVLDIHFDNIDNFIVLCIDFDLEISFKSKFSFVYR